MKRNVMRMLDELQVEYVVAPYEADAQVAWLVQQKRVDAVVTEDSDLLLFGCRVITKLKDTGECVEIDLQRARQQFRQRATAAAATDDGLELVQLRKRLPEHVRTILRRGPDFLLYAGVLSGCDYSPSLPGIGLKTAISKCAKYSASVLWYRILPSLDSKSRPVTLEYRKLFERALLAFRHQRVWHMEDERIVPLTPLPPPPDVDAEPSRLCRETLSVRAEIHSEDPHLEFLGKRITDKEVAKGIARGMVDPTTHERYRPLLQRASSSSSSSSRKRAAPRRATGRRSVSWYFGQTPKGEKKKKKKKSAVLKPKATPTSSVVAVTAARQRSLASDLAEIAQQNQAKRKSPSGGSSSSSSSALMSIPSPLKRSKVSVAPEEDDDEEDDDDEEEDMVASDDDDVVMLYHTPPPSKPKRRAISDFFTVKSTT